MTSLKTKIRSALGSMVLMAMLLALLAWFGTRRTTATDTTTSQPATQLQQTLADMRQSEQAYLLNYPALGFDAARTQHIAAWGEDLATARSILPAIASSETIATRLDDYERAFLQTVALIEQIGNSSVGLRATLARELSNLQTFASNEEMEATQVVILQLKATEDELALSENTLLLNTLNEQVADLLVSGEVTALPSVQQTQFNDIVARYVESVEQYALLLDTLGTNRRAFRNAYTSLFGLAASMQSDTLPDNTQAIVQSGRFWNMTVSLAAAGVLLTGIGLAYLLTQQMMGQIDPLVETFDQLEAGNLDVRTSIVTQDELGTVAQAVNQLLDEKTHLFKTDTERGRIIASMERLAQDVARIAAGDLSSEAMVTTDITGALADAFNFLREELSDVVVQVQETTIQVSASADQIQTTAEHLASGSEQQAQQIVDTSAAIDEMSLSIEAVSANSTRSAVIGEQAVLSAKAGAKAVDETRQGMQRVEFALRQAEQRIGRLQRIAREMRAVIKLIEELTERTSILSLNASIQSTDAERYGFQRVAVEVEQLAAQSADANQHIAYLVQTIEQDAEAAASRLTQTFTQVEGGLRSAENAAARLRDIEAVSDQLTSLIQHISLAAQQQVRGSRSIATAMNAIAAGTQQSTTGTKQATDAITQLAQLAEQLQRSVAQFRVT